MKPLDLEAVAFSDVVNRRGLQHARFGDLNQKTAVTMTPVTNSTPSFAGNQPALIHLSVTGRCYARCQGCINSSITASFAGDRQAIAPIGDTDPERDAACIVNLVKAQPKDSAAVCFYGGEPLLATEKINRIVTLIDATGLDTSMRYMLYTNGDLLTQAVEKFPQLMAAMWLISVSIDGGAAQHEQARPGTSLAKIRAGLEALETIRTGTVLMWSTLREEQSLADCFDEFLRLHDAGLVDQFFWHWVETKGPFANLAGYAARYETDLAAIMETYTAWLEEGRLLPITHINELVLFLLTGRRRNSSACGVERAENFDLLDGKIHSCADLPMELAIGSIDSNGVPRFGDYDLSPLVAYKETLGCYQCGVHSYCGGRCPVQAYISSAERLVQYCQLMRLHVGTVMAYMERIAAALEKNGITPQSLFDASARYAFFTDVTP